ncbi:MAG: NAD(P)/FAD-dependent oxidoreductase [Gammaproteobacteria bacterium]|nr:MAG: NAD(P)/FAD-dependent oxidoreductase [Gammaproteobacteria bacterium]
MRDELAEDRDTYTIAGAGPAGLAAAITLARAGEKVVVHEAQKEVGHRFGRDLQGLENWSEQQDVLETLEEQHITTDFDMHPGYQGVAFDDRGKAHEIHSQQPLFYLLERGPGEGSLDSAMLKQAQDLGVEVCFNSRLKQLHGEGVLATGPKAADAIAVGYHFNTDMENGFWVICDDNLAPKGYAYLLVMNGQGTIKSCMFSDFSQQNKYAERTVEAFTRLIGLDMQQPVFHGGVGNFFSPSNAYGGRHPIAGEHSGFQDSLWGFGIRYAITSGILAARSLLGNADYNAMWQESFGKKMRASHVNRALFSLLGNRGYRWLLNHQEGQTDLRAYLRRKYQPSFFKKLLTPWAHYRFVSHRVKDSCHKIDCECVWCQHGRH